MNKYLEIWKLCKSFPTAEGALEVVKDFDLNMAEGEFVCLIGHSGCGKSTVLSMVAGLSKPSGGAVILANKKERGAGPGRGGGFQGPNLLPWVTGVGDMGLGVG